MSVAPVVRVRFLVALIIVFGVLASAAGAVAVERTRAAQTLQGLLDAQDVVHRVEWPEGMTESRGAGGCIRTARSVCLSSELSARQTALAVARALALPETNVRERVEPKGVFDARGVIGDQEVIVMVEPTPLSEDGAPTGSVVDITLHDGQDVLDESEWRAISNPVR